MSIDAEKEIVLADVKQVKNTYNKDGVMTKPGIRYYSHRERTERQEELKLYEAQLNQPSWMRSGSDEQRATTIRRVRDLKQQMAKSVAPEVSGETKDALKKRLGELEQTIRVGMRPHEVQRRAPVGAVDHYMKWEKENKDNILEWKNIKRVLEPDDESKDLANVEMLRPTMAGPGDNATFMADAQIPGIFGYHTVPEEKWKAAMPNSPTIDTALKQVERQEQKAVVKVKPRRKALSPEVKAKLSENLAKAREKRMNNIGRQKLQQQIETAGVTNDEKQEMKQVMKATGVYAATVDTNKRGAE